MTANAMLNGIGGNDRGAASGSLEMPPWPVLAEEALYGLAGQVATISTLESEADPAAVLATFLTLAGIAFGRIPTITVANDDHHGRLFCAIVGRSARGRKGTSEGPVRKIWENAEAKLGVPLAWRPGPMSTGEGLINAVRDGTNDEDPGVPDKRLLMVEGEFAAPLRAMRREGNTLSAILRSAWDGKTLEPLTKANPIKASKPHVGIVGHITEAELSTLLGHVEIFNGFANRFLWWCVRRQKLLPMAKGLSDAEIERLGTKLAMSVQSAQAIASVTLGDDAMKYYAKCYPRLTEDQEGLYGVVTSRAEAQVIRLALIYACLDGVAIIEVVHLQAALAVWDYCDASAKRLFGQLEANTLENRVWHALQGGPQSTTDLHRALGNHVPQQTLQNVLEGLARQRRVERLQSATGGRSKTVWRISAGFVGANEAKKANKVI